MSGWYQENKDFMDNFFLLMFGVVTTWVTKDRYDVWERKRKGKDETKDSTMDRAERLMDRMEKAMEKAKEENHLCEQRLKEQDEKLRMQDERIMETNKEMIELKILLANQGIRFTEK